MVDKSLETERDLTLEFSLADHRDSPDNNNINCETAKHENVLADLIEKKKVADLSEKVIIAV